MQAPSGIAERLRQQGIIAENPQMQGIFQNALLLSRLGVTILICGESGVGKDRVAKFVHANGRRKNAPFIHINCSALPGALLEAELFGYEGGTFTGGLSAGKRGLLETADGGTLFLDEIGEMSLSGQVKLLDFLQTKEISRLGARGRKRLDVRIISATNRELKKQVGKGLFREDLYYRICVVRLEIPPLRERPGDIAALAALFLYRMEAAVGPRELTEDGVAYLQSCAWPGNVRELQNFLERVCILGTEATLTRELLERHHQSAPVFSAPPPEPVAAPAPERPLPLREAVARFEREYIAGAIAQTATLADAAARLDIDLDTLYRKKRKLGLYKNQRQERPLKLPGGQRG